MKTLVVEDDVTNRELLEDFLTAMGHTVIAVANGEEALSHLASVEFVILDVMMPQLDGWELTKRIRQDFPELPILMLTGKTQIEERVLGLSLGADDYLVKPYDLRELSARIQALSRRWSASGEIKSGELRIYPTTQEVYVAGQKIELSKLEFDLLVTLAKTPGMVWSRDRLIQRLWGDKLPDVDRAVDVRILALRKKLADDPESPRFIETVRGVGYRFRNA